MSKAMLPLLMLAVASTGVPQTHSDFGDCERSWATVEAEFCLGCVEGASRTTWQYWMPDFSAATPPSATADYEQVCEDVDSDRKEGCEIAADLAFVVYRTKVVNLTDFILEVFIVIGFLVMTVVVTITDEETSRGLEPIFGCLLFALPAVSVSTWILQIVALVDAYHVRDADLIEDVMKKGCFGYDGTITLNEVGDNFKSIRWIGIVELVLGVVQFIMSQKIVFDTVDIADSIESSPETGMKMTFDWMEFFLNMTIILLDLTLSGIDYFKFTLDLDSKAASIFEAWTSPAGHGLKACAFLAASEDQSEDQAWASTGAAARLNIFVLVLFVLLAVVSHSRR